MNKTYMIIMGAALLALAACSRDEVKETAKEQAIDFRIAVDTRAEATTTDNIGSFYVTAIDGTGDLYFKDVMYSDTDNDDLFTTAYPFFWPADGNLDFFAYSPGASELGGSIAINKESKNLTSFTTASKIEDQVDFITAQASGNKADNAATGVALEFEHRLSQIEIRGRNTNTGYVYKIAGVKIGKVASQGDFDFATGEWDNITTPVNYTTEYDTAVTLDGTAQSIMGDEGNAMLIPQELTGWDNDGDRENQNGGSFISVKVNVKTVSGMTVFPKNASTEYGWAAVSLSNTWEAGKHYIYTLDFTTGIGQADPEEGGEDILSGAIIFSLQTSVNMWN